MQEDEAEVEAGAPAAARRPGVLPGRLRRRRRGHKYAARRGPPPVEALIEPHGRLHGLDERLRDGAGGADKPGAEARQRGSASLRRSRRGPDALLLLVVVIAGRRGGRSSDRSRDRERRRRSRRASYSSSRRRRPPPRRRSRERERSRGRAGLDRSRRATPLVAVVVAPAPAAHRRRRGAVTVPSSRGVALAVPRALPLQSIGRGPSSTLKFLCSPSV